MTFQGSSGNTSPAVGPPFLPDDAVSASQSNSGAHAQANGSSHRRSNSKRCLRHDFARAKSKSMFRTHEPPGHEVPSCTSRRNSLKDMRK